MAIKSSKKRNIGKVGLGNPFWYAKVAHKRGLKNIKRRKKLKKSGLVKNTLPRSEILDALVSRRQQLWVPPERRAEAEPRHVSLSNFSFIDSPEKTLDTLRDIVRADCQAGEVRINFLDQYCDDIGPYLLFSMMDSELAAKNITGGVITPAVRKVLDATEIAKHLHMDDKNSPNNIDDVWPIKVMRCKKNPVAGSPIRIADQSQTATKFFQDINKWLKAVGFKLNDDGEEFILRLVGEVLDNALTHSRPETRDGEAWISGFMARRRRDGSCTYICHITVLDIGASIFESLSKTCGDEIRASIKKLISKHKSFFWIKHRKWTKQALWTLYALQDGVTRLEAPKGGKGLMDLIDFFAKLGYTENPQEKPRMCIISGDTCIKLVDPVSMGSIGRRKLALNTEGDLRKPPDKNQIWSMKKNFPGTILSLRFHLNPRYLAKLTGAGDE